ncbi:imm11 family protein [Melittangium boletus]|uniref:imm11 family protein n=1 Tax=Melittangium boletus TaxID=83453 RepID=UPI003DA57F86
MSERVARVFRDMAPEDVQLFPVDVEGQSTPYFLLNVARTVRCIDDAACEEVRRWTAEDGRPDRVGEYRVVAGLRIDPSAVGDARVFRPWGWSAPILVEASVKDALERTGIVGGRFDAV